MQPSGRRAEVTGSPIEQPVLCRRRTQLKHTADSVRPQRPRGPPQPVHTPAVRPTPRNRGASDHSGNGKVCGMPAGIRPRRRTPQPPDTCPTSPPRGRHRPIGPSTEAVDNGAPSRQWTEATAGPRQCRTHPGQAAGTGHPSALPATADTVVTRAAGPAPRATAGDGIGMFVRLSFGYQETSVRIPPCCTPCRRRCRPRLHPQLTTLGGRVDGNGPVQDQRRPLRVQHSAVQTVGHEIRGSAKVDHKVAGDAKPVAWSVRQSRDCFRTLRCAVPSWSLSAFGSLDHPADTMPDVLLIPGEGNRSCRLRRWFARQPWPMPLGWLRRWRRPSRMTRSSPGCSLTSNAAAVSCRPSWSSACASWPSHTTRSG
jgi:hypothetical protein